MQMWAPVVAKIIKCHALRKEGIIAFPSTWLKLGMNVENRDEQLCEPPRNDSLLLTRNTVSYILYVVYRCYQSSLDIAWHSSLSAVFL